jgi:tetratricopeptide (TPR) repeat protein
LPAEAIRTDPNAVWPRARWLFSTGDAAGVIRLWRESGPAWRFSTVTERLDLISVASSFLKLGQKDQAVPLLEKNRDRLLAQLASEPANIGKWCDLGSTYAQLGEKAEAQRVLAKCRELFAAKREGVENIGSLVDLAIILAWLGEKTAAFEILAKELRQPAVPNYANVHELERGVMWWPLQGDPRLEALVKDPLNNAPLP